MPTAEDIPFSDIDVSYHIRLCREAGFVRMTDKTAQLKELTWAGHEMLDQLWLPV